MPDIRFVTARKEGWCDQDFAHDRWIRQGDSIAVVTFFPSDEQFTAAHSARPSTVGFQPKRDSRRSPRVGGSAPRREQAIAAVSGESVDRRTIVVANPIKSLGAHEVSVKLHDEVSATVALNVVPA